MSSLTSRLAALASPAIGLGCMNLSHGYGQRVPEAEALHLEATTVARLDALLAPERIAGARYGEAQQAEVDTEEFEQA